MQVPAGVEQPFFTNNLEGWLKVLGVMATTVVAAWRIVKARVRDDIQIRHDINGVGERLKVLEQERSGIMTAIQSASDGVKEARANHEGTTSRLGALEESQRNVEKLVVAMEREIISHISDLKETVTGENVKLRERLVRLETISDLRKSGHLNPRTPEDIT